MKKAEGYFFLLSELRVLSDGSLAQLGVLQTFSNLHHEYRGKLTHRIRIVTILCKCISILGNSLQSGWQLEEYRL